MNPAIVTILIQQMPTILAFGRGLFVSQNPGAPQPTDEEVIAAYQEALASSLAKDAAWLDAHPE